jgi:malate dehydrogenase
VPITQILEPEQVKALEERTANGGAEIVSLLKTGSAYQAPGASIVEMIDSILLDKRRVLPCSVYLQGEYGIDSLFVGVPVKLGREGVRQIIELSLTAEESAALKKSAATVQDLVEVMARLGAETVPGA